MLKLRLDKTTGEIDLARGAGNLELEAGLETAVLVSLFTDRRAEPEDVDELTERRGWWADAFADGGDDRIGSRLWLLRRAPRSTATLRRAERYAQEALAWMVEDGVAESVTVSAEWYGPSVLALGVEIRRPEAALPVWKSLWEVHLNAV